MSGSEKHHPAAGPLGLPGAFAELAVVRHHAAGQVVFHAGAPVRHLHFVRAGRVVLQRHGPAGELVVVHAAREGEFFAEASLLAGKYHCTAVAVSDAEVACIPASEVVARLNDDPGFAIEWHELLARQLRRARARIERLSLSRASERVRHLLLTEGVGDPPICRLHGPVRLLAGELGMTPEALYRTLATMQRQRMIRRDAEAIVLLR